MRAVPKLWSISYVDDKGEIKTVERYDTKNSIIKDILKRR